MHSDTVYEEFIAKSRYNRWMEDEGRREDWSESVWRYVSFFLNRGLITEAEAHYLSEKVQRKDAMGSMRCLMTAGPALEKENVAGYNCAFLAIDDPVAFDEILYILMNGTGVGFSVEQSEVRQLPTIADEFYPTDTTIVVADSKLGWAKAFRELIAMLYLGRIPKWDMSKVRPAGSRLKTFGGRASGPEPLDELFRFTVKTFQAAAGRKLSSIEAHDLVCKTAEVVVVGGVRRSALISLSDLGDRDVGTAKSGAWWNDHPERALANNSAVYDGVPSVGNFMREWLSLYESKSGERGIFNRQAAIDLAPERRDLEGFLVGTNPCSEITLRSCQFCNLSEVIVREDDTLQDLEEKVRVATILGTLQATLTDFRYLRKKWKKNTEEEALLGSSLTGIMDHPMMNGEAASLAQRLQHLKEVAIETNREWAERLGINPAAAITCVKPSGTVSQLCNTASGIHARYSPYYIRSVRGDNKDPLTHFLKDAGVKHEPCVMKGDTTTVFYFPVKAPEGAVYREDRSAVEQLELWLTYQLNWCEHKPSITVSVKEDEWLEVGAWVYEHFEWMSGVSFLPWDGGTYKQAPYQECTEEEYEKLRAETPETIDWSKLSEYEKEDGTNGSQTYACSADGCEVVDI